MIIDWIQGYCFTCGDRDNTKYWMKYRYADTDSMFIHCKGYRRKDAFALGHHLEGRLSLFHHSECEIMNRRNIIIVSFANHVKVWKGLSSLHTGD